MKKIAALLGGIVAFGAVSSAQAAIIVTLTPTGNPPTQTAGPLTGYVGYTMTLSTDDGANITAVDFSGSRGFFGSLHQQWTVDPDTGDRTPTPSSTNSLRKTGYDTHFLFPGNLASNAVIGSALTEDNSGSGSPATDTITADFGLGSFLKGAFGIAGSAQSSTLEVAYLVLPASESPQYSGQVATSSGTFTIQSVVPEPASIGAMGLFAVGLLARRRRA